MSTAALRQTAKISSLEAGRAIYFIVASLALRQALMFFLGSDFQFWVRAVITFAFLFTVFRFSHGVAVIYELEKKSTEISTTPSSMRVELVFAVFMLQSVFFFLMSNSLARPSDLVLYTGLLLLCDLAYISVSKTIRDARVWNLISPRYLLNRWRLTTNGTAPRTHLQWTWSDLLLGIAVTVTLLPRPTVADRFTTGSYSADWALFLSLLLIVAGIVDYGMNRTFYFGGKGAFGKRKCIFVCSPLRSGPNGTIQENIRRAQWLCRELYRSRKGIPYASHAFYPYFLDDADPLDSKLGRVSALEFLKRCHAIYVYTKNGKQDDPLSAGMQEEVAAAKRLGLEIKFLPADEPPPEFKPVWQLPDLPTAPDEPCTITGEEALDRKWKKVFVCSRLRAGVGTNDEAAEIRRNVRVAQWLCYRLLKHSCDGEYMFAPFAPQAFYPFFVDYDKQRKQWLESTEEILQTCEAIYVYTEDGLDDPSSISEGMRVSIERAIELGLVVKYRKLELPPEGWNPQPWAPPVSTAAVEPLKEEDRLTV